MTFSFGGEYLIHAAGQRSQWVGDPDPHPGEWSTLFLCRRCKNGVVIRVFGPSGEKLGLAPSGCSGDLLLEGFKLISLYPKPQAVKAPAHVPGPIARNFEEATRNVRRGEHTSAVMMLRRVLDRATIELAPKDKRAEFEHMRLLDRIKALPKEKALTPSMLEWAHVMRVMGGEAEHTKDADEAGATEMLHFTEMFLIYAFTLPGRVAVYRKQAQAKKAEG